MDPITTAIAISAGASLLGGGISSASAASDSFEGRAFAFKENIKAREHAFQMAEKNFEENQRNRMFQERMRNSSYQAAVEDMRRAGINPMLAYMKGGADSPSGAAGGGSASGASGGSQIIPTDLGKGLSTASTAALDAVRLKNESEQSNAAVAAKKSEALLNLSSAAEISARSSITRVKGDLVEAIRKVSEPLIKDVAPGVGRLWQNYTPAGKIYQLFQNSGKGGN